MQILKKVIRKIQARITYKEEYFDNEMLVPIVVKNVGN